MLIELSWTESVAKLLLPGRQNKKTVPGNGCPERFSCSAQSCDLIPAVAEDAKQVKEEVDEVKVEAQGSYQRYFLCRLVSLFGVREHFFDLLCVVGCQPYENQDAHIAHNHGEHAAADENVDNRFFDIQGRELKTVPEHGIYIQNGKKVVVK